MITREQFGPYLLLKKLAEDPLGETFRAGRLGQQGMERVVLLRVLNGSALEGQDLWSRISNRAPVQQALKSPNIGSGVDLGQVQGVPYVAYDYISGKNLGSVFEQVTKSSHPVPTEHALLVAERLALGLAVAYETRVAAERILHGFLVPQLVLISNEGENRLLGFEVAPGLRALVPTSPLREAFGRYLSPESLAGAPPAKTDDVYSLGAILLELLLGRQLPDPGDGAHAALVQEVAQRGPAEVAILIQRSLAPPGERIGDVVTWHKGLSKILIDGRSTATTFNLAFFMHNLFREEIEKESQEIEIERTIEIPPSRRPEAPEPREAATAKATVRMATPISGQAPVVAQPAVSGAEPSGRRRLWLPIAALLLVGAGVGGWYGWQRLLAGPLSGNSDDGTARDSAPPTAVAAAAPPAAAKFEPAGTIDPLAGESEAAAPGDPNPEDLREQIDAIVAERTGTMERALRAQYDDQISALKTQLEAARLAQDQAEQDRVRAEARVLTAAEEPTATPSGPARSPDRTPTTARSPAPPERGRALPATPQEVPPPPAVPAETPATASPPPQEPIETAAPVTEATPPPPSSPSPPPPRPKRVRRGDLVPLAPDVVPPKLAGRLEPRYPIMARKMKREAVVLVAVLVNDEGRVEDVKLRDPKAGYGFDDAARQAARRARFTPATKNGVLVKVWTTIKIEFRLQ